MGTIYLLENTINGFSYVGQTIVAWNERLSKHLCGNLYIDRAIRKYGIENFKIITMTCPEEHLDWMETEWIKETNSLTPHGYNLVTGGHKYRHYSEETKEKLRGKNHPLFGKHRSKETKERISKKTSESMKLWWTKRTSQKS